ncbi:MULTISPECIES: LamG-like jellyroll fold domain-containing protein [unclassified Polaromonas]|uniref:LamG-like jellyroll fold domain-containing protein n=1 Tax=unclassified Polaromonas TaxID=2638319 RepID=UPI0013DE0476|nr:MULTISPECIES: LamG-like jellyroll fold domain-containing protein [unclassified Polaromonas]
MVTGLLLAFALGVLSGPAYAIFPQQSGFRVVVTGWPPGPIAATRSDACQAMASGHILSNLGTYNTWEPWSLSSSGLSCSLYVRQISNGVMSQNSGGVQVTSYCPENSELSGSECICKESEGYIQVGAQNFCSKRNEVDATQVPPTSPLAKACPAPKSSNPEYGNPIYPLTGSKVEPVPTGIEIGGIALSLAYDSVSKTPGSVSSAYSHLPSFGELWFTSLHRKLNLSPTLQSAIVSRGNGRLLSFTATGGVFTSGASRNETLVAITGGYRFSDVNGGIQEIYNSAGQLTSLATAQGKVLTFTYLAGDLASVQDNDGRVVRFDYGNAVGGSPGRRVTKITDTVGRAISATYDAAGNLASLTWQDGKVRQFLYENTSFAWALTGVTDENTTRYATFGYDSAGRAISTEYAGGVNRYSVSYGQAPAVSVVDSYDAGTNVLTRNRTWQIPTAPVLTTPNGSTADMGVQSQFGMPAITTMSQPAGSGCAAATSTQSYDANGNVASSDDFSGQRSCFANDLSRNLPTVAVEGLANTASCATVLAPNASLPAGSRKLSTQWHPDWSLATKAAQPLSLTTSIYNGQPDPFNGNVPASCAPATAKTPDGKPIAVLCKQVVQATTDADGHLGLAATLDAAVAQRVSSFTYDAFGRVLTSTDPLSRVTTYSYYSDSSGFPDLGAGVDPSFGSVSVLLHGDGSNNSTVMVDSASLAKTVAVVGGAKISTAQSKFGGSSIAFDGNDDYLAIPSSPGTDFSFGTGDFTVEAWFYLSSAGSDYRYIFVMPWGSTDMSIRFGNSGFGTRLQFASQSGALATVYSSEHTQASLAGAWHHVAMTRSGGVIRAFLDGNLLTLRNNIFSGSPVSSWTDASNIASITQAYISASGAATWLGYMEDIRITKGVARYTANFTPPTQAFPNTGAPPDPNAVGHTVGDLQSITNAAGHVTQFPLYDRAGRVRRMIDPKGVVTDTSYTPRGWISSVTVTPPGGVARTTNYTYDNAGQLIGVTLPDTTTMSYSYDAAHRLTGVTDTKGNSVTYSLDNMGNKVGEQVKDPSGNLQRNITRVYDALNRIQQITGASN